MVCASPDYLAERGTPIRPRDLVDHDCLNFPDWTEGPRWSFQGPEGEVHVDIKSRLQINNGFGIRYAALAGAGIGNYMDQQESELRAQLQGTGVSVTRVGDRIILNMPSAITFDVDQDAIKPEFFATLNSVAIVLRKFNRTLIDVNGHTDSTGSLQHNQDLSERRAGSVASYLGSQGIDQRRMSAIGFGPSQPVATNATEAGRAQNRRVEIQIAPITQNG